MQRWGSEQGPRGSVLLRTGALMSLASLGTAGLVLCGALAVGGPSGAPFAGALGSGPSAVTVDPTEQPAERAAPSARGPAEAPDAPRRARDSAGREKSPVPVGGPDGTDPLSGTTSSAVQAPADDDSVLLHSVRVLTPSAVPSPSPAHLPPPAAPQPAVSAVRDAAAGDAPAKAVPARPRPVPVQAPQRPSASVVEAPQVAKAPRAAQVARAPKGAQVAKAPKGAQVAKAPKAERVAKAAQVAKAPAAPPVPELARQVEQQSPPTEHGVGHPHGEPPGRAKQDQASAKSDGRGHDGGHGNDGGQGSTGHGNDGGQGNNGHGGKDGQGNDGHGKDAKGNGRKH